MTFLDALALKVRFACWAPLRAGRYPSFYDSHSQFGEDMLVRSLVGDRVHGTFVDVGAHHPVYFSNTYHFYRRGWRGLNIDALPGSMDAFNLLRPGDINVEACVAPSSGQSVVLHIFEDSALTTIDANVARMWQEQGRRLRETRTIACVTLVECLHRYLAGRQIDVLSIDIEGLDEAILRSHDWEQFAPDILIVERHGLRVADIGADPFVLYLAGRGYEVVGASGPSLILRRSGCITR